MSDQFQISAATAATVVVTTVGIYLALVALVRLLGPRSLASMSSFDFASVVALGAGVHRIADVRCVVLERNGALSVVRADEPVDPWLLADVRGLEASG